MRRVLLHKVRPHADLWAEARNELAHITFEPTAAVVRELHAQAVGYVWGWQDAGGGPSNHDQAWLFGNAYMLHAALYATEARGTRTCIHDAFTQWRETGVIK
jgi:hypothetical protein